MNFRKTEVGRAETTMHVVAFGEEAGECEVDSFDFALPAFGFGAFTSLDQVGFDLGQAWDHFRVDVQHRAANAGVFVGAGCGVGPSAGAEFDFTFVEVRFDVCPFFCGDGAVFLGGARRPSAFEVGLVVAGDVFFEDGDVAAGGFQIQVSEQCGADVNR